VFTGVCQAAVSSSVVVKDLRLKDEDKDKDKNLMSKDGWIGWLGFNGI